MKIKALLLGMIGLGMAVSSCNLDSDDDNNYMNSNYSCSNLVISEKGDAFATRASYMLTFYPLSGKVSVSSSDLNLGMGANYSFTSSQMDCETRFYEVNGKQLDVTSFSGGSAGQSGLQISDIKGFSSSIVNWLSTNDPANPAYGFIAQYPLVMSYNVNGGAFTVKTFQGDAIYSGTTTIVNTETGASDSNTGVRYRVIFTNNYKNADVILYNANFGHGMPVTVNIILKDLDVTYNKNGYIISGADITPSLYSESEPVPFPSFPFKSFEFINTSDDLTSGTIMYTVMVSGKPYNCDFQGYYCLSGKKD